VNKYGQEMKVILDIIYKIVFYRKCGDNLFT